MNRRPRRGQLEKAVIHVNVGPEFEGSALDLARYLNQISAGYHEEHDDKMTIVTALDNQVVQGAPYMNENGKHHCIIGQASQSAAQWMDPFSKAAMERCAASVAVDCKEYGLAPRRLSIAEVRTPGVKGICGHIDVTNAFKDQARREGHEPLDHWDPGPNFPWPYFIKRVKAHMGITTTTTGGEDVPKDSDVVDAVETPQGNWQLTYDGGVRTVRGKFFGSYPGLPASVHNDPNRRFNTITARPNGAEGYVLVSLKGEPYEFGPGLNGFK